MICHPCRVAADTDNSSKHDECLGNTHCCCQHRVPRYGLFQNLKPGDTVYFVERQLIEGNNGRSTHSGDES